MKTRPPSPTPLNPIEEAIFSAASALTPLEVRTAFLDRACAGDADLRRRIESLLEAEARAVRFFANDPLNFEGQGNSSAPTLAPSAHQDEHLGSVIARYKLLQKIGEGGMGV